MSTKKTVKIKLRCDQVSNFAHGQIAAFKNVDPVMTKSGVDEKHENTIVVKETPQATFEIQINKGAPQVDFFEPGREYYFDVTAVPLPKEEKRKK